MKKQVLFSLVFALVATIWTTTVRAQTQYELWVAGTQVTSENCNDLSVRASLTSFVALTFNSLATTPLLQKGLLACGTIMPLLLSLAMVSLR